MLRLSKVAFDPERTLSGSAATRTLSARELAGSRQQGLRRLRGCANVSAIARDQRQHHGALEQKPEHSGHRRTGPKEDEVVVGRFNVGDQRPSPPVRRHCFRRRRTHSADTGRVERGMFPAALTAFVRGVALCHHLVGQPRSGPRPVATQCCTSPGALGGMMRRRHKLRK